MIVQAEGGRRASGPARAPITPVPKGTPKFTVGRCECGTLTVMLPDKKCKLMRCRICKEVVRRTCGVYAPGPKEALRLFTTMEEKRTLSWLRED